MLLQNHPNERRRQARTEGKDLPEQNAVRPDVTQCGVEVVEDALRGHPLHREKGLHGEREEIQPSIPPDDVQQQKQPGFFLD